MFDSLRHNRNQIYFKIKKMITPDRIVAINETVDEDVRAQLFESDGSDSDDGSKKNG